MRIPAEVIDEYNPDGDSLCLDFINTVSWRGSPQQSDFLKDYARLVSWAEMMEILGNGEAGQLIEIAARQPQQAGAVLGRAIALREALYRIFSAFIKGNTPAEEDVALLNREVHLAWQKRSLTYTPAGMRLAWEGGAETLERILWPVAQSAADLLAADDLARVGECLGEGCGWLFIDASKNKSRRWCSMNDCGNREKARRHYQRKKASAPPG